MHIQFFCHKLALIVNTGLDALSLKTLPPCKAKESVLGFFPVLGKVLEEEETESLEAASEVELAPGPKTNSVVLELDNDDNDWESDYGNADETSDDESAAATVNESEENLPNKSAASTASHHQHAKTRQVK